MARFLILGAGSMGCLLGAKLALAGNEVDAYGSKHNYQGIAAQGLYFHDLAGQTHRVPHFRIFPRDGAPVPDQLPEFCLISCKATSTPSLVKEYADLLQHFSEIFLLQNGLGNEDIVRSCCPKAQVYRLITSNAARLDGHNRVVQTGQGETFLCSDRLSRPCPLPDLGGDISKLHSAISNGGFPMGPVLHPVQKIWEKAIVNMVINPLGAIAGMSNGELAEVSIFWEFAKRIIRECLEVASFLKIPLQSAEYYESLVKEVIAQTKLNRNSMLQDIDVHRITELAFLNGYLVKLAKFYKAEVPVDSSLVDSIRKLQRLPAD